MSSSRALCCLPSMKKQKHDFQVCFVDRARHEKIVEDKGSQNTKRSTKVAKELFADYESNYVPLICIYIYIYICMFARIEINYQFHSLS